MFLQSPSVEGKSHDDRSVYNWVWQRSFGPFDRSDTLDFYIRRLQFYRVIGRRRQAFWSFSGQYKKYLSAICVLFVSYSVHHLVQVYVTSFIHNSWRPKPKVYWTIKHGKDQRHTWEMVTNIDILTAAYVNDQKDKRPSLLMTQQERKNKKKERESKYHFFLKPKRGTVGSVRRPLVLILYGGFDVCYWSSLLWKASFQLQNKSTCPLPVRSRCSRRG